MIELGKVWVGRCGFGRGRNFVVEFFVGDVGIGMDFGWVKGCVLGLGNGFGRIRLALEKISNA